MRGLELRADRACNYNGWYQSKSNQSIVFSVQITVYTDFLPVWLVVAFPDDSLPFVSLCRSRREAREALRTSRASAVRPRLLGRRMCVAEVPIAEYPVRPDAVRLQNCQQLVVHGPVETATARRRCLVFNRLPACMCHIVLTQPQYIG